MSEISDNVLEFYKNIQKVEDHRYKSWEHCYNFFKEIRKSNLNEEKLDLAQLHLSFYLASWGMYRGSSFILQKDYTIFEKIVIEILKDDYNLLWDIKNNYKNKDQLSELFVKLYKSIEEILKEIRNSLKEHPDIKDTDKRYLNERDNISPTLTTKILMGTIGCIPAYDRFFIDGLKKNGIQQKFNPKKSLLTMIEFYEDNKKEIDLLLDEIKGYPLMKILDMYFWSMGYENDK